MGELIDFQEKKAEINKDQNGMGLRLDFSVFEGQDRQKEMRVQLCCYMKRIDGTVLTDDKAEELVEALWDVFLRFDFGG
jgi:hypothetical protein